MVINPKQPGDIPGCFKELEGWGGAFKYITDKIVTSGGKINFELAGMNIQEALAGDANMWVGRYTSRELQQVTGSARLLI